jgi:transposase
VAITFSERLLYALQNNVAQGLHAAPSGLYLGDITKRTTRLTEGVDQICKILSVTRETVSLWFDAWETQGLDGLRDKPRAGRPAIYSDAERERLFELVQEQPHQMKAVQARLQQETGKGACTMTLKRALKKSGV